MKERLFKLRQKLQENQLDAVLITHPENRRYLSGFTGSAGVLLISQEQAILATDFRYFEQMAREAPDFTLHRLTRELPVHFPDMLTLLGKRRIGFEAKDLSYATYKDLTQSIATLSVELVPTYALVGSLRAVKDEQELGLLQRAAALGDLAFETVTAGLKPGTTERQLAWQLERFIREHGGDAVSFDTIVASGPNAALPHHHPSDRQIKEGETVIIDMGTKVEGYCSDMTRSLYLGTPNDAFRKVYDTVLSAQLTAIATVQAGMTGQEADSLARRVIEQAGYGEAFGHGLGHSIGLAVHEEPRLNKTSAQILTDGMVFTIEPGIYLPGWGGVRIEDMVVLEGGKAKVLTRAHKKESSGVT